MRENLKGAFPPPLTFAVFLVLGLALHWTWPMVISSRYLLVRLAIGGHLLFVAGTIAVQAFWLMRKNETPIDFKKPTTAIITKGPFRFTRNPLYLSLLILYASIAILLNSPWFLPFLIAMLALFNGIAKREEEYLEETFSEDYIVYRNRVRRWL